MKKILFILILAIGNAYAKPCMTDIYFGNGVWNTEEQAIEGKDALRMLMFSMPNSRLNRAVEGQEYDFKHAYNPTKGTIDDLIETFYQLRESGQITDGYFMGVYAALAAESNGEAFIAKLRGIISNYNSDASTMFSLYENASFSQKHNVLLVAHSQGNLFGNKMYTLMNDKQKEKFRMVSVATPANHVKVTGQTSPYVTVAGDYVIGPIPNSLPANAFGFGHTFIGTYLNLGGGVVGDGSDSTPSLIAFHVKSAYNSLMQSTSCSEYAFTRVWMLSFGVLNVYGNVDGKDELVGTVTLEESDAILDPNNNRYRCEDEDSLHWGDDNYIGHNWTFNYKDDKYNSWLPGKYITSRTSLDNISNTKDTVRKDTKCVTLSLEEDGDLYTMIYDMFPE